MKKSFKRTAAFVLALTLVAGVPQANVGGLLTRDQGIVAHAEPEQSVSVAEALTISNGSNQYVWNCQEMCSRRIPKILDRQESGGMMS